MGEIKQANFRIDTDTAAQFREFCEKNSLNQAQGFDHIMQVAEMDKAKAAIPERSTEIEEFERHAKGLLVAYLNSLEIAENTEERILEQFKSKLESKDQTIIELQERLDAKEELATAANTAAIDAENRAAAADQELKAALEKEKAAVASAKDKEEINAMLAGKLKDAEAKLAEYPELKERNETLNDELTRSYQIIKDNQKDAELERERAVSAVQVEKERALAALEKEHNAEVKKLYLKIDSMNDERVELKEKIMELKAELAASKQNQQKSTTHHLG